MAGNLHRPTKDLDLLGFGTVSVEDVAQRIREIARIPGDDGIVFDADSVVTEVIKEDPEYEGSRPNSSQLWSRRGFECKSTSASVMQFIQSREQMSSRRSSNESTQPSCGCNPPEVVIAEKLHVMVILDIRNSRMKDFFDMWYLARSRSFDLLLLRGSIKATFERRRTQVPTETPFALTDGFLLDETKGQQWRGFLHRLQLEAGTPDLVAVGSRIVEFVGPILRDSIIRNRTWHSPEAAQNRSSDSSVGAPCVDLTGQQFSCSSDIQTRVHEPALLICSALLIFQRLYSSRSHLGMDHQILALDGKTLVLPIPASNTDSEEADRLVAR